MNVFDNYLKKIKEIVLKKNKELKINSNEAESFKGITVEVPPGDFDFDLSCNMAMVLAKKIKENPKNLANEIKKTLLEESKDFESIEVAGPGFLNIKLSNNALQNIIIDIDKNRNTYGSNKKDKKYNIEFVSANPTGPMHVGHCRGAIFGDVLSNLLQFNGNKVTKEYYINDYGNQINNFVESVFLRLKEIKYKEKFPIKKELYTGNYIIDIANKILKEDPKIQLNNFKNIFDILKKKSLKYSMDLVKSDLKNLGIKHDIFFSESELLQKDSVKKTVTALKKNNFIEEGYLNPPKGEEIKDWKKTKRLIFKSTLFGDDSDRSLQKDDGSWTYFANDMAYHADKVSRNYDYLINILGADHTGYIKRITAAVSALSNNKIALKCKVCQLVKINKKLKNFNISNR